MVALAIEHEVIYHLLSKMVTVTVEHEVNTHRNKTWAIVIEDYAKTYIIFRPVQFC